MRRYSEAVKADVRKRLGRPRQQSVARISEELGIQVATLNRRIKVWHLQEAMVPASEKDSEC